MKKVLISVLIIILLLSTFAVVGCNHTTNNSIWGEYTAGEFGIKNESNPLVEITFSTGDTVRLELYPDEAPITVANFINLAKKGYYNGLTMHRIIENFMIQGGGYVYGDDMIMDIPDLPEVPPIKGEFESNGVENNVSHLKGVISMARATAPNTATSQFFICSVNYTPLDGEYAAFGRVIDEESMQAVLKMSRVETGSGYINYSGFLVRTSDIPCEPINIVKVDVYNVK